MRAIFETYATMTTGNGGVQTSMIYAAIRKASAYMIVYALPSLANTHVTRGAAVMKPTALPTKTSDMIVWELW